MIVLTNFENTAPRVAPYCVWISSKRCVYRGGGKLETYFEKHGGSLTEDSTSKTYTFKFMVQNASFFYHHRSNRILTFWLKNSPNLWNQKVSDLMDDRSPCYFLSSKIISMFRFPAVCDGESTLSANCVVPKWFLFGKCTELIQAMERQIENLRRTVTVWFPSEKGHFVSRTHSFFLVLNWSLRIRHFAVTKITFELRRTFSIALQKYEEIKHVHWSRIRKSCKKIRMFWLLC